MTRIPSFFLFLVLTTQTAAFNLSPRQIQRTALQVSESSHIHSDGVSQPQQFTSRRNILAGLASAGFALTAAPFQAMAEGKIPMLSTDEFMVIVRDSARSIQRVEFSGPSSETVRVLLIDGTVFGLNDVIESPVDPRSPLKVQAACREAKIPFKNLQMEAILANAPKKTKMYTNQRVQDAAGREKERLERLAKDEEERLAKLFEMEQKEDAARAAAEAK